MHPGTFIRGSVMPAGMSVTEAAERLGVGRPALSNFLNGKSSLSPGMAAKLERAFGADAQDLLERQAAFDREKRSGNSNVGPVRPYVPSFLAIEAQHIQDWGERSHAARRLLPVLARKLIHSTGSDLHAVDFPGYENAERHGWDGWIEAGAATPWIPEGESGWELSTNKDPRRKAEKDYAARISSVARTKRQNCTFVFATSRNWPGKREWANHKHATNEWKAVRAFDASDLEQWLEQSISAQVWLADQLGRPVDDVESLDGYWQRWATVCDPQMTPAIFEPSITAHRDKLKDWLAAAPNRKPLVVAADSKEEALAFLARVFQEEEIGAASHDITAVFQSSRQLRKLRESATPVIPIVHTDEAEQELAHIHRRCIVVRTRNACDSQPDVSLDLLDYDAFRHALTKMGISDTRADQLAIDSGRSPTVLRRQLSKNDAIRRPEWAKSEKTARRLVPMALAGAWHTESKADQEIISFLAEKPYPKIQEDFGHLLEFNDSPIWSAGQHCGVSSRIDALFTVKRRVTAKDLHNFFFLAEYILSETDPSLDLPERKRWIAAIYGKVRNHSDALRKGICETLILLSVHGNDLFRPRLGIDVEGYASNVVRKLLSPLSLKKLRSLEHDLPYLAETDPRGFLELIEEDLRQPMPITVGLLKPAESGPFHKCPRTGLLWALECLAWKHLGRVSAILAQLSRVPIDDNWANKPAASLAAIYRSWMPQTAAPVAERLEALKTLTKRFPDIGWHICIAQVGIGPDLASPSYHPLWRSDASGAGRQVPREEREEFERGSLDLALAWPRHDENTLGDLVERVSGMPSEAQVRLWSLIDGWAEKENEDKAKAHFRDRLREIAFHRLGRLPGATNDVIERIHDKVEPRDIVIRHAWLFASHWIDFSPTESDEDHDAHTARIRDLRTSALREIWERRGFEGVTELLSNDAVPNLIGHCMASGVLDTDAKIDFLRQCLSTTRATGQQMDGFIAGLLRSVGDEERLNILSRTFEEIGKTQIVRLLRCAPFCQSTWRMLDRHSPEVRDEYWCAVSPDWWGREEGEENEIVDRLLEAQRPRAAFLAVHLYWSRVETARLKRLLRAVATEDAEPIQPLEAHYISEAVASLDGRKGVTWTEMAEFEFMFLGALEHGKHGIPNLERHIAQSPISFVQALALVFTRNDGGEDPAEWGTKDTPQDARALAAHRLLGLIAHVPGTNDGGEIDVEALCDWIDEARRLCVSYGRSEVGDQYIGQLLSRSPASSDDLWPLPAVCEALERMPSPHHVGLGFCTGLRNGRGVTWRAVGEGGKQERELAARYRRLAERQSSYPYVSGLLEEIAADYERQGTWEDDRVTVEKRLRH